MGMLIVCVGGGGLVSRACIFSISERGLQFFDGIVVNMCGLGDDNIF